jgi:colanic acid/amylovoran biosynthesis protein
MRVIISHVYSSDNKGDAALTSVLIDDIKQAFPEAEIVILTLEPGKASSQFEGVPEEPSFMKYALDRYRNPLAKLAYTLYMMLATLMWAAWWRFTSGQLYLPAHLWHIAQLYAQADLIVPVGGGYLRSRPGLFNRLNIPLLLHPLLFGWILGKPMVLYSQSIGPFHTAFERTMVRFVLKRMDCILLREDISVALLADIGVTDNVVRAVDSGFLFTSTHRVDVRAQYHIPHDALLVGVTVRAWLKDDAQSAYETAVAQALDALIEEKKAHVIFIPQVTAGKGDDDRIASKHVYDLMRNQQCATVVSDIPDHYAIKALYDQLDILLGTRFHSVIFSLTSFVPVVAIEYEHKTAGIMHDLGLDRWVIKIEEVSDRALTTLLHDLIREREAYCRHLKNHLPAYISKARQAVTALQVAALKTTKQ